jgi:hypothetical protein
VPQALPHAPQWAGSLVTSVHAPPQSIVPASQTHLLALQIFPPEQAVPQVPQFCPSLATSTQPPEQTESGAVQLAAHWPSSQTSPLAHACAQPPQFAALVLVLTQLPPHRV